MWDCGRSHLGGRDRPDFEVVRSHENVGNSNSHVPNNPFVKILRLCVCNSCFKGGINDSIDAQDLVVLRQHRDVVLEWIGYPVAFISHIRNALMCIPIILFWQCLVNAVIEVFVVGEDDMPSDVVELRMYRSAVFFRQG